MPKRFQASISAIAMIDAGVQRRQRLHHLGRLAADPPAVDRKSLFLPANLPDGIVAADPMLGVRNASYPLSYRHRQ